MFQIHQQLENEYNNLQAQIHSLNACADQEKRQGVVGNCRATRDQLKNQAGNVLSRKFDVERDLQRTPQQLAIYASYRYTRRDVTMEGRMKGGYRIVDSLSAVRMEQKQVNEQDTRRDYEIADTQPQDTSGIKERAVNLPSEDQLSDQLVRQASAKIATEAVNFLRSFPGLYLERARKARDRGAMDEAVENYILFLSTTAQKGTSDCQEAELFLRDKRNLIYRGELP